MIFTGFVGIIVGSVIILLSLLLMVRGYSIQNGMVVVHGLAWSKTYPIHTLCDIEYSPHGTTGSIRTFGIGGLFSYLGYFRSTSLGNYISYVTDNAREVILYFDGAVVVLSPDDPVSFIKEVRSTYRLLRVS